MIAGILVIVARAVRSMVNHWAKTGGCLARRGRSGIRGLSRSIIWCSAGMCRRWLNQLEQWVQVGDVDGFNFSYYASLPGGLEAGQTGQTAMHPGVEVYLEGGRGRAAIRTGERAE